MKRPVNARLVLQPSSLILCYARYTRYVRFILTAFAENPTQTPDR